MVVAGGHGDRAGRDGHRLAAAAGLTRLMTSLLYEVKPTDLATFAAVAAALA